MDAPRPFKQSAWNSLGGARTPERLSISGNDVSGFMTEQRNHSNNNYLQITINDPDGINDTKIERIRRVAGRMQESIGFPSAGTLPANFQTHSQRQESMGHQLATAHLQGVSAPIVTHESPRQPSLHGGLHTKSSYGIQIQENPDERIANDERVGDMNLIFSVLHWIKTDEYLEPYKALRGTSKLMHHWDRIVRQKRELREVGTMMETGMIRKVVRVHLQGDMIDLLQNTLECCKTVVFTLKTYSKQVDAHSNATRGPPRRKDIASTSRSPRHSPRGEKPIGELIEDLTKKMRKLNRTIAKLTSRCKSIRDHMEMLFSLDCAHNAYTMLYYLLENQCRQHTAHFIDLDMKTCFRSGGEPNDVKFRFAIEPDDSHRTDSKMLVAFRVANNSQSMKYYRFSPELVECLLELPYDTMDESRRTPTDTSPWLVEGAQLARLQIDGRESEYDLAYLNHYWQAAQTVTEVDMLRLAKDIAIAVLNFNSTPWSGALWGSNDVKIFIDDEEQIHNLASHVPHLRFRLDGTRNSTNGQGMLCCLGIVLYELWKYFPGVRNGKKIYEPDPKKLDLDGLPGIKANIVEQMGEWVYLGDMEERYANIVRWCLDAPLDGKDIIRDPKQLCEMHSFVVGGLDELEKWYIDLDERMNMVH